MVHNIESGKITQVSKLWDDVEGESLYRSISQAFQQDSNTTSEQTGGRSCLATSSVTLLLYQLAGSIPFGVQCCQAEDLCGLLVF
jgi:hypothetical protein